MEQSPSFEPQYEAKLTLEDNECDNRHIIVNFWIAPVDSTSSYFIIDLGCDFDLSVVVIRNSHNFNAYDRYDFDGQFDQQVFIGLGKPQINWFEIV